MWKSLGSALNKDKWYLVLIVAAGVLFDFVLDWLPYQGYNMVVAMSFLLLVSLLKTWITEVIPVRLRAGKDLGGLAGKYIGLSAFFIVLTFALSTLYVQLFKEVAPVLTGATTTILGSLFLLGFMGAVGQGIGLWKGIKAIVCKHTLMWLCVWFISWQLFKLFYWLMPANLLVRGILDYLITILIIYSLLPRLSTQK